MTNIKKSSIVFAIILWTVNIAFAQDPFYPDNDQIKNIALDLANTHPDIVEYNKLGTAEISNDSIIALKISDNVTTTEDEPVWVFTGIIHGREKLGLRVLLDLANDLAVNYSTDTSIRNWVDSYEIWLVFSMNPYGYQDNLRKNGPNATGIDLNRNWNFRWNSGGSADPSNSNYHGNYAGSESEIKAVSDLYLTRRPIFGITFHQGNEPDGGQIMRPWYSGSIPAPPDASTLLKYSQKYANMVYDSRLKGGFCESIGRGEYAIMDPDGSTCGTIESSATFCKELCWKTELSTMGAYGQSSNWCYAQVGTIDLTVEISDRTFNEDFLHSSIGATTLREEKILAVVTEFARNHTDAIKDLFHEFSDTSNPGQFNGTGITGHITNSITGDPVEANIEIQGYTSNYVAVRKLEPDFGRFWRFLPAGEHKVEVSAYGYSNWYGNVTVSSNGFLTDLDIKLQPWSTGISSSVDKDNFLVYPNPVTNDKVNIELLNYNGDSYNIKLNNLQGLLIKQEYFNSKKIELNLTNIPKGLYILTIQNNKIIHSKKIIILRKN